jgi:hypothetical protein
MKMLSKNGALAFAVALVLAVPGAASAATWGPVGTTHVLDSTNMATSVPSLGAGWQCSLTQLHTDVRSPAILAVTATHFTNCLGTGNFAGCSITHVTTQLPWTGTDPSLVNVTFDGFGADLLWEGASCAWNGVTATLTGALASGVWDAAAHSLTYINASGVNIDVAGVGTLPATYTGTLRDTSQTLTLTTP